MSPESNGEVSGETKVVALTALILAGAVIFSIGEPKERHVKAPPPPAAEILSKMFAANDAGKQYEALSTARNLIKNYPGTPEAGEAARLLPDYEANFAAKLADDRARELAAKWSYRSSGDSMSDRTSELASIRSENEVRFDFPYEGAQRGTLTLRKVPGRELEVYLEIERGQFMCHSFSDCEVHIRFDNGNPQTWSAGGPADHSTTIVFIHNGSSFLRRLHSSKTVRIQTMVFQEGAPVFEFNVAGFDYEGFKASW